MSYDIGLPEQVFTVILNDIVKNFLHIPIAIFAHRNCSLGTVPRAPSCMVYSRTLSTRKQPNCHVSCFQIIPMSYDIEWMIILILLSPASGDCSQLMRLVPTNDIVHCWIERPRPVSELRWELVESNYSSCPPYGGLASSSALILIRTNVIWHWFYSLHVLVRIMVLTMSLSWLTCHVCCLLSSHNSPPQYAPPILTMNR